jgi:ubiquinone/menaquinone biosynthesis C-methylase UbiE
VPRRFVAAEFERPPPGRVLDLACGEGRNAVWLATRGWRATGVDFSAAAITRAQRLADDAGVPDRVEFVVGDVARGPLPAGPFDAVIVAYLQLSAAARRTALRRAAGVLAPGGVLLVVAHDTDNLTHGTGGPRDPDVLYTPADVIDDLADRPDLVVEKAERVRRPVPTPDGDKAAIDALVRVRRTVAAPAAGR